MFTSGKSPWRCAKPHHAPSVHRPTEPSILLSVQHDGYRGLEPNDDVDVRIKRSVYFAVNPRKGHEVAKILIPASSPEDWKQFLAEPEKQWKSGYSARSLAYCWQEADGIPPEIISVLEMIPSLKDLKAIFAIPEHKVPLPGGARASQNDVWVLAESISGLVSIAVEGKVSEPFGPTVGEWLKNMTTGKEHRLRFLCGELGLEYPPPMNVRYQLLHRTVSAIVEAKRFRSNQAVMVVHTFSRTNEWLEDYQYFLSLFGLEAGVDQAVSTRIGNEIDLSLAWVHGSEKYLES